MSVELTVFCFVSFYMSELYSSMLRLILKDVLSLILHFYATPVLGVWGETILPFAW